jgi:hypothetical protein
MAARIAASVGCPAWPSVRGNGASVTDAGNGFAGAACITRVCGEGGGA